MVQLISQLRGYFYVNPILALSLAITIFSFVGVPPLIGFFAKQMVLSAALDSGYVFLSLVAILCGILVIISKNPIVSVLFLIGLFACISLYLIILGLSFRRKYYLGLDFRKITLFGLCFRKSYLLY